jgi:broad specificity phosphatase PhoE
MTQRWKMSPNQSMVTDPDGDWVEYSDHLAAIAEKDREIERLTEELDSHSWEISPAMAQQRIDKLWAENKRLERDILMLVRLCLSHGIISRGLACEYLGCAREDLDGILDQIATEAGEDGSDEIRNYSK